MSQVETTTSSVTESRSIVASRAATAAPREADPNHRHFSTDHLLADLKGRSVRGGAITLAAQAIKFVLQMGSTMVLARLLTPADFGLIAMVVVVTGFATMFKDAGLSMATVQRDHITHEQVSTLFWINVALSVVMMVVVAALAPAIAWFYGEPQLIWITLAFAGTFIFSGLTVQHQALLQRQMRFRALAVIETLSLTAGIATAITMAFLGFGFWSLVGLPAGTLTATCILVWIISAWTPGWPVRGSGVRPMLGFGANLTGFNLLNYFRRNGDNLLIGRFVGADALGIYSKAYAILLLPVRQMNAPVSSVALSVLARLRSEPERFARFYCRGTSIIGAINIPLVFFFFVEADSIILLLLGDQWIDATSILRILFPAALATCLNVAPGWLFVSLERPGRQMRWALLTTPLVLAAIFVGLAWGVVGVAVAVSGSIFLTFLGALCYACRDAPVSFISTIRTWARPFAASITSSVIIAYLGQYLIPLYLGAHLAASALLYAAAYGTVWLLLPGGIVAARSLLEDLKLILQRT